MVKICSRLGWHASSPRQCCKFSRHGCWIKLTPAMGATLHSKWDCGTSPTRLRQGSNELEPCWTVQTRVDVSYTESRGSILFVSWPRKNATCNMFFGCGFVWMLFKINFQNRTMSCDFPRPYATTLLASITDAFTIFQWFTVFPECVAKGSRL